jgi:hypothetical protein
MVIYKKGVYLCRLILRDTLLGFAKNNQYTIKEIQLEWFQKNKRIFTQIWGNSLHNKIFFK